MTEEEIKCLQESDWDMCGACDFYNPVNGECNATPDQINEINQKKRRKDQISKNKQKLSIDEQEYKLKHGGISLEETTDEWWQWRAEQTKLKRQRDNRIVTFVCFPIAILFFIGIFYLVIAFLS